MRAARAAALLAGREFVTPDDVKDVALPALRHRLVLAPDIEIEGRSADAILRHVPAPRVDPEAPFQMLVTTLGYDDYRGATASGRISAGRLRAGMPLARITHDGSALPAQARYLYQHQGLERIEVSEAVAGDIVVIAGLEDVAIGETLADAENPRALPAIQVEEPTLRMTFGVNTSPFTGREGRWSTSRRRPA